MQEANYLPIFIRLNGLRVLIVGGGTVGSKRAKNFLDHGADVTVVSLVFNEYIEKEENIKKIRFDASTISENFISEFNIIVTATNDLDINQRICDMAKRLGKLCNNPTNPQDSNFIVPIFYADNDLSIAVTTYGKSSIVSKLILEKSLTALREESYIRGLIDVMSKVKTLMKGSITDPRLRYELYHKIFNDTNFESMIIKEDYTGALRRAEELINEYNR
ncbi:bifunctional precorrin-2 dehydrogenase/sirohydrochlorin ferrochelatase [Candidatus Acidianus copahuensis]|uniref:precorrin-2 dehydrogenase n=1 Tax=Candidatus Acidianus copahuensis TaxID=1160895 RepID=A0A031LM24_9CREN|nr:bifunctional precorrin-2 dehydrogenase/sirohydrochlorin ferrochelatase [Candidatus Acidianus copahuensis]EZQ03797.1 siroheme synthase [Candidatus Acidianus copahuensis]NON63589.1 bifunctional precorrin-2 dehydrogenase/sirohydrochlorin ferrochelatase [Acidianus sp. RZ1]